MLKKQSERRNSAKEILEDSKSTEKALEKKELWNRKLENTSLLKQLENLDIFLIQNQNPWPLFIGNG